jgi:hypothetical protein
MRIAYGFFNVGQDTINLIMDTKSTLPKHRFSFRSEHSMSFVIGHDSNVSLLNNKQTTKINFYNKNKLLKSKIEKIYWIRRAFTAHISGHIVLLLSDFFGLFEVEK